MKCYKCGKSLMQSGRLFWVNGKEKSGIFGCICCIPDDKKPDVGIEALVSITNKEDKTTH
jgi:hypothetical protein